MSERLSNHETIVPVGEIEQQVYDSVARVADETIIHRRFTDPVEGVMLAHILQQMSPYGYAERFAERKGPRTTGLIDPILKEAIAFRKAMGQTVDPGYLLRLMEFSIDMQACELFPDYPNEAHHPEFWSDNNLFEILDYSALRNELLGELGSCMIDGYAFAHAITNALGKTLGYEQTIVDHGCSMGHPLKQWILGGSRVTVFKEPDINQPIALETLEPDEEFQEEIDRLSAMKPAIGRIVGYDRATVPASPNDRGFNLALRRMKSHTFPMGESRRRPDELKRFYELAYYRSDKLVVPRESISADDQMVFAKLRPYLPDDKKVDVNIRQAMMFQQASGSLDRIEENRRRYFADSWTFTTDFFKRQNPRHPKEPRFVRQDWWHHPGSFAMYGHDPNHPDKPPREIARFLTRRGTEVWLTEAGKNLIRRNSLY